MIVERMWQTEIKTSTLYPRLIAKKTWRGWFLFGIIPLYIKMIKLEIFA